ncbi:MAG: hypothetical protein WBG39_15870, partial [Gordonia sp. (in: high G+C Gram-positive bacteria)]
LLGGALGVDETGAGAGALADAEVFAAAFAESGVEPDPLLSHTINEMTAMTATAAPRPATRRRRQ